MQRSRWQPLLAADDVGYLHEVVVHDIGQVIGRQLVGRLIKHLVVEDGRVDDHFATDEVVDMHVFIRLNLETYDILLALGDQRIYFFLRKSQRVAHLQAGRSVILEVGHFLALSLQFFGRIESDIGFSCIEQHLDVLLVNVATFGLTVGTVVTTKADTLVERNTEPLERLQNIFFSTRNETVAVGVFDTENEITSMLARKKVIIQRGAHTADVQSARRTRGKTDSDSSFCHNLPYFMNILGGKIKPFFPHDCFFLYFSQKFQPI